MVLVDLPYRMPLLQREFPVLNTGTCFRLQNINTKIFWTAILVDPSVTAPTAWVFEVNEVPQVGRDIDVTPLFHQGLWLTEALEPVPEFEGFLRALPPRIRSHFGHKLAPPKRVRDMPASEAEGAPPPPPQPSATAPQAGRRPHPSTLPPAAAETQLRHMQAFVTELKALVNKYF